MRTMKFIGQAASILFLGVTVAFARPFYLSDTEVLNTKGGNVFLAGYLTEGIPLDNEYTRNGWRIAEDALSNAPLGRNNYSLQHPLGLFESFTEPGESVWLRQRYWVGGSGRSELERLTGFLGGTNDDAQGFGRSGENLAIWSLQLSDKRLFIESSASFPPEDWCNPAFGGNDCGRLSLYRPATREELRRARVSVPEPASFVVMALGLLLVPLALRRARPALSIGQ